MLRPFSALVMSAALISLGAGCVEKTKYDALERKYNEREAAIHTQEAELAEARTREQVASAQCTAAEKEALLLKAKLEGEEVEASMRAPAAAEPAEGTARAGGATTRMASAPAGADAQGVAPVGEGWNVNPVTGGIVLDAGVLFGPGSGDLRHGAAEPVLDRLVAEMTRPEAHDLTARIEGHTDDLPINKSKNKDNWELAGKRALAVLHYLEEHGVAPERLSFAGYGSYRPIDARATKDARAQNRRVEVLLLRRK